MNFAEIKNETEDDGKIQPQAASFGRGKNLTEGVLHCCSLRQA